MDGNNPTNENTLGNTFLNLFPLQYLIPFNLEFGDHWVVENNPVFDTQWVECSYPISGGYGPTPRYIFYSLALFALCMRKRAWVITAALGSVMTYSSTAAVHAIVLVTLRTKLVSQQLVREDMVVLINGTSNTGYNDGSDSSTLWLPVLPMAWDNDDDPVLAIVGTAFLALLPMQLWSTTFK